jgi:hypothetical protein
MIRWLVLSLWLSTTDMQHIQDAIYFCFAGPIVSHYSLYVTGRL